MSNNLKNIVEEKFNKLFGLADEIIKKAGWEDGGTRLYNSPNPIEYNSWKVEALNLINKLSGKGSSYYNEFMKISTEMKYDISDLNFPKYYGLLKGLYNDFKEGLLLDIRNKISAELIADYLEQSKFLFEDGFYHPAASLTGAVLEDTLRKLCDINDIKYPLKTNINNLNTDLAKKGVYNKLTQKLITAYADIRNNVDHGNFKLVKKEDVKEMINWVSRFVNDHLE